MKKRRKLNKYQIAMRLIVPAVIAAVAFLAFLLEYYC